MKRTRHSGISTITAVLVVIILVLGAALAYTLYIRPSASNNSTATSSGTLPSDLVTLAQAGGGTLTDYSIIDPTSFNTYILPAFQQTYPWAKVNFVPLDPGSLVSKPIAEYKAGHVLSDVVEFALPDQETIIQAGACKPWNDSYYLSSLGYPQSALDPNSTWFPWGIFPNVWFYNTNLVQPAQVPKDLSFLTDSTWKGKITVDSPSTLGSTGQNFATYYPSLGNASWTQLMKGFIANQPQIASSGGTDYTLVSNGQAAIGLDTVNDIFNGQAKGDPVKVDWSIVPEVAGVGTDCLSTNGPHPYMAELYLNWLLSPTGQESVVKAGFFSDLTFMNSFSTAGTIPSNVTFVSVGSGTDLNSNPTKWTELYHSLFGS